MLSDEKVHALAEGTQDSIPFFPYIEEIGTIIGELDSPQSMKGSSNQPELVVDIHGTQWVRKRKAKVTGHEILAESIGWLASRYVGLRTPEARVLTTGGDETAWFSRFIQYTQPWYDGAVYSLEDTETLGRMLALDAVLVNEDRNYGNVLLEFDVESERYRVWSIDMGLILAAYPQRLGMLGSLAPPLERIWASGAIPVGLVRESALQCAHCLENMPEHIVEGWAREACRVSALIPEVSPALISGVLNGRFGCAERIVTTFLDRMAQQ